MLNFLYVTDLLHIIGMLHAWILHPIQASQNTWCVWTLKSGYIACQSFGDFVKHNSEYFPLDYSFYNVMMMNKFTKEMDHEAF